MKSKSMNNFANILLMIGGLNWGLVGLFEINLVANILGEMSTITRVVYTLVGLSGLYSLAHMCNICKSCK